MLHLDDFDTGRPWPPPQEAHRLARYKKNKLLFEGQLDKVYGRWVRVISGLDEETHYALTFPKRLSFLWADLVFGERPAITVDEPEPTDPEAQDALEVDPEADPLDVQDSDPAASSAPRPGPDVPKGGDPSAEGIPQPLDPTMQPAVEAPAPKPKSTKQDKLNDLLDRVGLHVAGHESVIDISRYGDAVIKLYRDVPEDDDDVDLEDDTDETVPTIVESGADAEVGIEAVDPNTWFPIRDPYRPRKIKAHVLAWVIDGPPQFGADTVARIKGEAVKRTKRLVVEIHESGTSTYRTFDLEHGGKIGQMLNEEIEETDLDTPLVFHIPGPRTSERLHGLNDYESIDSQLEYLVWLMAARQSVILKHQDPSIVGPPGQLKEDEETGALVYDAGSRYFEIDDPTSNIMPEYLTWDGKLDAAFRQSEELWNELYTVSETSPVAFSATKDGFAESGTSLRIRMQAPLKKAERIATNIDPVWRKVVAAIAELDGLQLDDITIEWRDGLPGDDQQESEVSERDIRSGLTSKLSERMRRYKMTEDQARQEQERIDEETQAAAPSFADRLLGAPAGTALSDDPNDPLGLADPNDPPKGTTPPQLAPSVAATKRKFGKA